MSESISHRQLQVLEAVAKEGAMTPWALHRSLRWDLSKYPTAKQACIYLTRKGFLQSTQQSFTREKHKAVYTPTTFGLLELMCVLPDRDVFPILSQNHNIAIFPLLHKLTPTTRRFLIDAFREVWKTVKTRERLLFRTAQRLRDDAAKLGRSDELRLAEQLHIHEDGTVTTGPGILPGKDLRHVLTQVTLDLEDAFYHDLFIRPFESATSSSMESMKKLILKDPQLTQIAQRIIGAEKRRLFAQTEVLETIEKQLGVEKASDPKRILQSPQESFRYGRYSEIVSEVMRPASVSQQLHPS